MAESIGHSNSTCCQCCVITLTGRQKFCTVGLNNNRIHLTFYFGTNIGPGKIVLSGTDCSPVAHMLLFRFRVIWSTECCSLLLWSTEKLFYDEAVVEDDR